MISLVSLTTSIKGLVLKFQLEITSKNSDCVSKLDGSTAPKPYAKYLRGILAVSFGSFCLNDPPAAFLGFANLSLIVKKSFFPI